MTTITDPDKVKILVNYDVDPTKLTRVCADSDDMIKSLTNIDWSTDDYVFGILKEIGNVYAAWSLLIGWENTEYLEKAKEMKIQFDGLVEKFQKIPLPENKTNPDIDVAESEYTIHALNPDVPHWMDTY